MKAILEFNLDEPDEQERYRRVNKADSMAHALYEIWANGDDMFDPITVKEVSEMCHDNNINFEEIWT